MQIANTLHRSRTAVTERVKRIRERGLLLKAKNPPRCRSIKPDPQDFDKAKRDYCWERHIKLVKLCARLEGNDQLAAELYRSAQAAKLTRLARWGEGKGSLRRV